MKIGIFGNGGHAREVFWSLNSEEREGCKFFVDDEYYQGETNVFPISNFNPDEYRLIVAVADSKFRERIVQTLPNETKYFTFVHPSARILGDDIIIGEGSFIGINCILTTNIALGKHTILNRGNQIGHDCEIGDYFSAMPGAIVSGNVKIGHRVYMGTNATIKQKLFVCSDVTIGSNATVVKHIQTNGTYVGVPAKLLSE